MRIILLASICIVFLNACQEQEYQLCPDNATRVIDLQDCPPPTPKCPECDDDNACTKDLCSKTTDYKCKYEEIIPCDGNKKCEEGEFSNSSDCPLTCDDKNHCTQDSYNYLLQSCINQKITPCCGNTNCEPGETYITCQQDCEQLLDILVTNYERRTRFEGHVEDLTHTQYTFILVEFKVRNIGIDIPETLNHKTQSGFYYDPYKIRAEDDDGNFYDIEYESDLINNWLDYAILSKGTTRGAALLYIVPRSVDHLRLVAYDRYGSKLDVSEIY